MLRLISSDYRLSGAVTQSYNANTGFAEAIVCALSMLVAYMSSSGRIGGLQIFILCFIGQFFYCFNEIIFWRHVIGVMDSQSDYFCLDQLWVQLPLLY